MTILRLINQQSHQPRRWKKPPLQQKEGSPAFGPTKNIASFGPSNLSNEQFSQKGHHRNHQYSLQLKGRQLSLQTERVTAKKTVTSSTNNITSLSDGLSIGFRRMDVRMESILGLGFVDFHVRLHWRRILLISCISSDGYSIDFRSDGL